MKNVKITSTILFYITRIVAILYLATTFYSLLTLLTEWSVITSENGKYFSICFPFTEKHFLNGENNWAYKIFNFLIPIGFYGIFFLLLSNVFNAFRKPKLFTKYGVNQLRNFYLANITLPFLEIVLASIFAGKIEEGLEFVAVIHFFLGVFAYFMAAIFKQGLQIQNEQDLFI
jgi:positive regulator of sigma E activity